MKVANNKILKPAKKEKMREVVICQNGSFGLSPYAIDLIAKSRGQRATFYKAFEGGKIVISLSTAVKSNAFGVLLRDSESENSIDFNQYDIPRDDPDLIKTIKKLGEKANTQYSSLKIVEIPFEVKYTIIQMHSSFSDNEYIIENHREWS